MRAASVGKNI